MEKREYLSILAEAHSMMGDGGFSECRESLDEQLCFGCCHRGGSMFLMHGEDVLMAEKWSGVVDFARGWIDQCLGKDGCKVEKPLVCKTHPVFAHRKMPGDSGVIRDFVLVYEGSERRGCGALTRSRVEFRARVERVVKFLVDNGVLVKTGRQTYFQEELPVLD